MGFNSVFKGLQFKMQITNAITSYRLKDQKCDESIAVYIVSNDDSNKAFKKYGQNMWKEQLDLQPKYDEKEVTGMQTWKNVSPCS